MSEIMMAVEALKLCVDPEAFNKAMEQVKNVAHPEKTCGPDQKDVEDVIQELLTEVGMPMSIFGFRYAATGIRLILENPGIAIVKELYPGIAEAHGTTATRAERAIRHAVEVAFTRGDQRVLKRFFGNSICSLKGKATNAEFLFRMAYVVRKRMEE